MKIIKSTSIAFKRMYRNCIQTLDAIEFGNHKGQKKLEISFNKRIELKFYAFSK